MIKVGFLEVSPALPQSSELAILQIGQIGRGF
jgi:hypothetical protein